MRHLIILLMAIGLMALSTGIVAGAEKDVDEAQGILVNLAKDLAAKGEIMITKNRADDELVF